MTTVTVRLPGSVSQDAENPNYEIWTFNVTVDGRAGLSSVYLERGATESHAASMTYTSLMANPSEMHGITSTGTSGPGDAGNPSLAVTGPWTGPIKHIDDDDDDEPHKMKTADGT